VDDDDDDDDDNDDDLSHHPSDLNQVPLRFFTHQQLSLPLSFCLHVVDMP